ncbi:unnamed protein product [Urochloa humidicola]
MPLQNGARAAAAVEAAEAHQWQGKPAPAARPGRRAGVAVLLLVLRVAALCASAAAAALAATHGAALRRAPFRLLLAANAIVAVYSAFEAAASAWEASRGATLLPEPVQVWFDFGHDQGFGYMALAAAAVAAAACARGDAAVALGFAAFAFLAAAAIVTGFRVACFVATGSRSPPPASSY